MFNQRYRLVQAIVFLYFVHRIVSKVELTNIKCTSLDPDFDDFEYCFIKSVNRSYKYLSLKVNLFKTPITKVKVNLELLKRFSGYKPFLYNITVDACRFLRNPKSNPIAVYLHTSFRDHSNMNHTCPFDHDIIVEKLSIDFINQHITNVLPFPIGDYLFQSNWLAYDINRANVRIVSKVEFTNINCTSLDPDFDDFEYCFLKSVNRSYKYLSLKVNLFKTPITKVKVNLELLQRLSGYKPFLYNITFDACRFLKYPKSNPIAAYMYEFFRLHSNMNHTCPFDHDLIVEKLSISFINRQLTEVLPFPLGDYLFRSNWIAYDINRASVRVYFTIS